MTRTTLHGGSLTSAIKQLSRYPASESIARGRFCKKAASLAKNDPLRPAHRIARIILFSPLPPPLLPLVSSPPPPVRHRTAGRGWFSGDLSRIPRGGKRQSRAVALQFSDRPTRLVPALPVKVPRSVLTNSQIIPRLIPPERFKFPRGGRTRIGAIAPRGRASRASGSRGDLSAPAVLSHRSSIDSLSPA